MNTVLIVGATGVVGEAALEYFCRNTGWQVIAVSRRKPNTRASNFTHLPLDLSDSSSCKHAASELSSVTHVIYAAVAEKPGLVSGWRDQQQMQLNLAMLENLLHPLSETANLKHISILQGAKAYGAHAGTTPPIPVRESLPRDNHENFYWLQEDLVRQMAEQHGFSWTIFRPQVIIGAALGAAMNPVLPLVAYAAIRRQEGLPFSYPGGSVQIAELVDSGLLAEALAWAATSEQAKNETFNITNGDVFCWKDAWPQLSNTFSMPQGADETFSIAEYLLERGELWEQAISSTALPQIPLADFLGQSHYYLDILLRRDASDITHPTLMSTIKLRQAGFQACRDSIESLTTWIERLQANSPA